MSADKQAKQAEFRKEIGAPFSFVADSGGQLIKRYDVKAPLITLAKRATFVIGADRKVLFVDSGGSAVDPSGALEACKLY